MKWVGALFMFCCVIVEMGREGEREKDFVACRNLDLISSYHIFRCFILIFDLF
jgi:hypothetical protein